MPCNFQKEKKGNGFSIQKITTTKVTGGNFIDAARRYGESEALIGEVISSHNLREEIVIASKTPHGSDLNNINQIRSDVELSLVNFQTDWIDLYYLHLPPDEKDVMNRALDELDALKFEGKIKCIGASIKGASAGQHTINLSLQYIDSKRIDAIMLIYSILRQDNFKVFH